MADEISTAAEAVEASAMPRAKAVHADGGKSAEQEPLPAAMANTPIEQKSPAQWAYERLILYIQNFEKTLDAEHEVAMGLTDTGAGVLRIEGLGFFDPDMITFYGSDMTGARIQLVQHVTMLNVVLRAMQKPDAEAEARRIGFELAKSLEDEI
ncbi:MAG: DUF6173 family protein [Boseongicola sp.]|nr:DUF6173 family protein [Boseongicola sp.]MDD9978180.1 DUF6173 family protein [Boseongicola sp.]